MVRSTRADKTRRRAAMPYVTSEMSKILQKIQEESSDPDLVQSIHFSPTILTFIRHLFIGKGIIITDSMLTLEGLDPRALARHDLTATCYIDNEQVVAIAEKKHVTRAEIAIDHALNQPGPKLVVIGSAPSALSRILNKNALAPLHDLAIIATPTGYASVVQLKEQAWESNLPTIVSRGHKGGANAAISIVNAILSELSIPK